MQEKKISKGTKLNRIIAVELLCLVILIGIYAGIKITRSGSEETGTKPNTENEITITPEVTPEITEVPGITGTPELDDGNTSPGKVDDASPNGDDSSNGTDQNNDSKDGVLDNTGSEGTEGGNSSSSEGSSVGNEGSTSNKLSQETFLANLSEAQTGESLSSSGAVDLTYYMQTDERWGQKLYGGSDTIGEFGCGPTSLAMVISAFTNVKIDPEQMCKWAYDRGYWYSGSGSIHGLIPDAAKAFGLKVEGIENTPDAVDKIKNALSSGNLIIVLMGKGTFTKSGHFIVLRGITEDGKILIADPNSKELTKESYEPSFIVNEAKAWAAENGPFWVISK
ncbi:C39 family peptidase [Lachnoclostridium phytofermentans]|uniref:Peptidase C39-like domain-containing protein n=1 Tax=Lachnoclostridium phytofermentans (strain ATCC 700394 / DSM 18823 / ISDg) TaxID=357809 RepID=A9KIM5_LACP7|nr:C39 family peptidase [Lachnoclostridium phytofermentans]ABX43888.1 hypothetical protein Cphy_3539 [Lachnoclostridium phytofermentans ISDg]